MEEGEIMSSQEEKVKAAGMDQTLFVSLEEQRSSLSGEEHDYGGGGNDDFLALGAPDSTAIALEKCEKYVLRPYRFVLKILGWAPFTRDGGARVMELLRYLLVFMWVLIIIITFITQILSCFRRDNTLPGPKIRTNNSNNTRVLMCEEHLFSAFILTDILLLVSYLFGIYLFSHEETEYLSNLASKVFIKSANQDPASSYLVWTITSYFCLGIVWIGLSLCVRIMTTLSVEMWSSGTVIMWSSGFTIEGDWKIVLIILDLIGFLFFDMVYVAAVMNYAAQSEMNIYLLSAIRKLVQDKSYGEAGLDGSIKDIIECRQYVRVLNGKTATATALVLFNLGSLGIIAIINLHEISNSPVAQFQNTTFATVTAGLNVVFWIALVSFPFIQAARVTDACLKMKGMGPELRARPQLYASTPQLELDSYVTLTQAVKLRATMFGVPIYPWMWWAVFGGVTFTSLILFQTGAYNFSRYL